MQYIYPIIMLLLSANNIVFYRKIEILFCVETNTFELALYISKQFL